MVSWYNVVYNGTDLCKDNKQDNIGLAMDKVTDRATDNHKTRSSEPIGP